MKEHPKWLADVAATRTVAERVSLIFERQVELRALLIDIRAHFGRDSFHDSLTPELRTRLFDAIGDGIF